jgi:two-component system response regulator RegA
MREPTVPTQERILLIDDDELVAGSLREYLVRGNCCQVDVADELSSAEELMAAQQYDVVLVDPYFTGRVNRDDGELLARIRELQPLAALIVLTGYASPSLEVFAGQQQGTVLLTKPQPVPYLSQLLVSACRRQDPLPETESAARLFVKSSQS